MALTEAQRRANNKYIKENMTVLGCKVRKNKAELFRATCKHAGTTPNAVFTEAINHFMIEHGMHEGSKEAHDGREHDEQEAIL